MIPLTEAEQEAFAERVAIIMEGAAMNERDASKLAMEGIISARVAKMDGRSQARELARMLRQ